MCFPLSGRPTTREKKCLGGKWVAVFIKLSLCSLTAFLRARVAGSPLFLHQQRLAELAGSCKLIRSDLLALWFQM